LFKSSKSTNFFILKYVSRDERINVLHTGQNTSISTIAISLDGFKTPRPESNFPLISCMVLLVGRTEKLRKLIDLMEQMKLEREEKNRKRRYQRFVVLRQQLIYKGKGGEIW
jgi:hypothetical protein